MSRPLEEQLKALQALTVGQLRARYVEVFGEPLRTGNRSWLIRRLAWRLQALAEGGLSTRASQRATFLANEADIRLNPPRRHVATPSVPEPVTKADPRLPPAGSILRRIYKGRPLQVRVLHQGFEFDGAVFPSLSAVAHAITASHYNGFLFFRLGKSSGGAP